MSKWAIFCLFFSVLLITAILCLGSQVLADVNDPMAPPPEKNIPAFLNISGEYQVKRGALRLGTDDVVSPFNYQLEVLGEGAKISNVIAEKNLKVSNVVDTLFVDATNNKVCLGPCLDIAGAKLEVSGGGMMVNGDLNTGIFAVSQDSEALYGSGDTIGVQGVSSGADNYGIWAFSALGTAIEGVNITDTYSSVYGYSDTGYGVYGTNTNLASLWAGYFVGRVESNSDVSGAKFLPTQLQSSLVPFTSGQVAGSYSLGNISVKHFDGTHLWAVDNSKLYKIRATDGFKIFDVVVGTNPTDVLFDGNYIWITVEGDVDKVFKVDPYSGIEKCSLAVTNPQSIAFDGQYYWVTAEDGNGDGILVKVDSTCTQVGGNVDLTTDSFSLGKIIYNGSYLVVIATDQDTNNGAVININPSTGQAVRWDGLIVEDSPTDIFFDNYYYWVTNKDDDTISRFYLSGNKYCSQLDSNNTLVACQSDSDCSDAGLAPGCFAYPELYGTYDLSTDSSHIVDEPFYIAFDGTYIWVTNHWTDSGSATHDEIVRYSAYDPNESVSFPLTFEPTGLLFDGTYLWISSSTGLTKIYSGTGYSSTDLSGTLTLQNNSPLIQQDGSIDISGSGRIGGDVTADGELNANNNVWGEETAGDVKENGGGPLAPSSTHVCPDGHFIKDIALDAEGKVTRIECRAL